jgi:hypothetical protein
MIGRATTHGQNETVRKSAMIEIQGALFYLGETLKKHGMDLQGIQLRFEDRFQLGSLADDFMVMWGPPGGKTTIAGIEITFAERE